MRLFETIEKGEVYFIAEMSGNHGGSLERALEIVRAAAEAGADCLKLQTYTADTITIDCDGPEFRTQEGGLWEGRTLYDLYQEAHTPWEWQAGIKAECERLGMDFLSSVFDPTSVDFLEGIGCEAYKIASPELVDVPLIEYAASKGKPMVISCGMGSADEVRDAVDACRRVGNDQVVLLKCTSEYPAVYEDMNIATMADMRQRFGFPVGLSDHSMGYAVDVAAAVLGASVIEKHFCITREEETVDSAFSMEKGEFAEMVRAVRNAKAAVGRATYERTPREEANLTGRRSLYAVRDIRAGEPFTNENVRSIRPGYGLAPKRLPDLLGKAAPRNIAFGSRIERGDLEGRPIGRAVTLRKVEPSDVGRIFEWVTQPWYVNEFAGNAVPTPETHKEYFDAVFESGACYLAVLYGEEHVGCAGVKYIEDGHGEGWWYIGNESMRGRGIGTALIAKLVEFAKKELGLKSMHAYVLETNVGCRRALEKNGFSLTLGDHGEHKGIANVRYDLTFAVPEEGATSR